MVVGCCRLLVVACCSKDGRVLTWHCLCYNRGGAQRPKFERAQAVSLSNLPNLNFDHIYTWDITHHSPISDRYTTKWTGLSILLMDHRKWMDRDRVARLYSIEAIGIGMVEEASFGQEYLDSVVLWYLLVWFEIQEEIIHHDPLWSKGKDDLATALSNSIHDHEEAHVFVQMRYSTSSDGLVGVRVGST